MKAHGLSLFAVLLLSACAATSPTTTAESPAPYAADDAPLTLTPVNFAALPGWEQDDLQGSIEALARSCVKLKAQDQNKAFGDAAWQITVVIGRPHARA